MNQTGLYVIPGSQRWELVGSARDENSKMRSFQDVEKRGAPIPLPMRRGDILLFSNMTFHGSKVNHTYSATPLEQEGEDFLYNKLRKGTRIPFVVRGVGERLSFETWQSERAKLKQ